MTKKRVVITGMGVVSPVGSGVEKFWQALLEGKSGVGPITTFDVTHYPTRFAAEVKDYNAEEHFNPKDARNKAKFVQYAIVATREALKNANLDIRTGMDPDRAAVLIGSGIGSIHSCEVEYGKYLEKGPDRISPHFIPRVILNEAAGQVSMDIGATGFATCVTTACATGTNAVGDAMRFLQYGDADVIVAGGTESATTILGLGGFCALKALSERNDDPQKASRPFDKDRDGFVMGEGCGVLVMETLEHAQKRGAKILAECVGYGRTSDAYHITAPHPEGTGAVKAMKNAIQDAGLTINDISYINAHGTSTQMNDKVESLAIKKLFGEQAYKIPVSSTKSMTGHLLGAAGGIELIICIMAIRDGIVPPTINYTTPDPECDLDYVPNVARKAEVKVAMSNSLGFGGHNATVVVKRYE
ncbi:MAG: beta-ketoacyl-ACP synthase II [Candidatus Omnitrophica bacterium]|nr:beta-ketoacyl-ACP synthase II [Candidatus Omnitrophota bacterium]